MSQISLTASMRSNLLSLQGTADLMSQTQERLANGKKVNSAIDNAGAYYTAQSLSNRASDLGNLLDSMGQAVSTIKAANEGIEAITSFVEQAKAVATSAADTTDAASRKAYGAQFNSIMEQIDKLAKDSGYKGINLLQNDKLTVTFNESRDNKLEIAGVNADYRSLGLETQDWDVMGKNTVKTAADAVSTKEAQLATAQGSAAAGKKDVTGAHAGTVAGGKITISSDVGNGAEVVFKAGNDYYIVKGYTGESSVGSEITIKDTKDAYEGVTDHAAAFKLEDGKDGNYYMAKATVDSAYDALVTAKNTYTAAVNTATATVTSAIDSAIAKATSAIDTLRSYASDFGNNNSIVQTRQSFTENLINVLEEGADNLVLADMNEESANMLALQTRQQLAINSLSLASQASQSVLRLFS